MVNIPFINEMNSVSIPTGAERVFWCS